jgi:hypothetical protein
VKYLENRFRDELGQGELVDLDNGVVKISGMAFESLDILEIASANKEKPTVYDQAFDAWRQDHVSEKIDQANSILSEGDQFDRFLALQQRYAKSKLLPFVGAGMSFESGFPLWRDFLLALRRQTNLDENAFVDLLNQGGYEEAAEQIATAMTPQAFSEAIYNKYGLRREICGVVHMLPDVFPGSVITTNFDHMVRDVYRASDVSFAQELLGYEAAHIRTCLEEGSVLLKLHGNAEQGGSRVLTKTEYATHYEAGDKLKNLLGVFADRFSLLFLGCSLTKDRPIQTLKTYIDAHGYEGMPKHYAFLEMPAADDDRIFRERELSLHHIYPIWYPKNSHEESIAALLIKLREDL